MKILSENQLRVGLYLRKCPTGELDRIEVVYNPPEFSGFGCDTIVAIQTQKNGIQKLSFGTIKEWEIFSIEHDPEVFL